MSHKNNFWGMVEKSGDCLLWRGHLDKGGYGHTTHHNKFWLAHRLSYYLTREETTELTLDHLCRVRNCVNPEHLEPVTSRENILRGEGLAAQHARKTHCKNGHLLSGNNLSSNRSWRICKQCNLEAVRRYQLKKSPIY